MSQVVLISKVASGSKGLLQLLESVVLDVALVQVDDFNVFGSVVFSLD